MTEELPERDLLRTIDPAPRTVTVQQQERHLRAVQARIHRPVPARPARVRLVPVLLGAAAAASAAALVLPAVLPADAPRTPVAGPAAHPTERPAALTAGSVTRSGVRILASARVGDALFLLGSRDEDVRLAASFDGSDPDRSWERVAQRPALAATGVDLFSAAGFPDAGADGVAQVAGRAGREVVAIDIRDHDGDLHRVAVADGYWLAAWSGRDFSDTGIEPVAVTVHLRDGATRTEAFRRLGGW